MADDTRYQGKSDFHPRGGNSGGGGVAANDPLAELARLIGQNDPFSEFNRGRQAQEPRPPANEPPPVEWQPSARAHDDYNYPTAVEPRLPEPPPQYVEPEPYQYEPSRSLQPTPATPAQRYEAPRHEEQHYPEQHGYQSEAYQNGSDPYAPPYDRQPQPGQEQTAYADYERPVQPAPPPAPAVPTYPAPTHPAYDERQAPPTAYERPERPTHAAYDDRQIPSALDRSLQPFDRPGQPSRDVRDAPLAFARDPGNEFERPPLGEPDMRGGYQPDEPYMAREGQPQGDDIYDEAPTTRRRGGLITVVAVLLLAVVGTAGAFGYRAMFGSSGSASAPPVIRADVTPSKVVPPPVVTAEAPSGKISYERVGGGGQGERVLPREETPVEVPTRSVAPPPSVTTSAPPAPAAAPSSGPGEPRKVRTVTIRPDQPPAAETAARAPGGQPFRTASAPTAPPAEATATRSARPASAAAPPQPAGTGPLQLTPEGTALPPPPAAAAPAQRPAPPARTAARAPAAAPVGEGGYLVQVSSQRSEADARSSFRTLQGKFPTQLGERQPIIRRADLGDKGVFYRAQIGPFGTVDEATKMCSELKAAGGQCVVSKN